MNSFRKLITPLWIKYPYQKTSMLVFCTISYKNGRLSITGVEGPNSHGGCRGSCGQIDTHLRQFDYKMKFATGWSEELFRKFLDVWDKWHLNDMHAECEHQEKLGWTYKTHEGQKCPECGYEIGTVWTRREVPEDVLTFLSTLPDAIRPNPWRN